MLRIGDRVRHQSSIDAFGTGTVLKVDEKSGSALVEWDTHKVERTTAALSTRQTHVNLTSLVVLEPQTE